MKQFFTLIYLLWVSMAAWADIAPTATYTDADGLETTTTEDFSAEAPLHVVFRANASFLDADASLEWHFHHTGANGTNSVTRYGDETEYDFVESGLTTVALLVRQGNEVVDSAAIRITISESHLEMPNAFSPNGDEFNQFYQAKSNYKSIVYFHAYIFNRWGQKLYEWTDYTKPESGWDGTFHGTPVKDGVYFVLVKARGADGRVYNIRRDVNLLRKFNEVTGGTANE